jgi:hypothetical protein
MKYLGRERFEIARRWVLANARPVDVAIFRMLFEGAPVSELQAALIAFQNPDGGLGRCLEPDFRLQESSVMATAVGTQHLVDFQVPSESPLVQSTVRYLSLQFDLARGSWPIVPQAIDEVPRAIWWNFADWEAARSAPGSWGNPAAEIVAFFHRHRGLVDGDLLQTVSDAAWQNLAQVQKNEHELEMHAFLCYLRLLPHLTGERRRDAEATLIREGERLVARTPDDWSGYGLRPHWAITSPASPLYPRLREVLEASLDWEIDAQSSDGTWAPFWHWGRFEAEWETAKNEWTGHLTVKTLRTLKAFGRISG